MVLVSRKLVTKTLRASPPPSLAFEPDASESDVGEPQVPTPPASESEDNDAPVLPPRRPLRPFGTLEDQIRCFNQLPPARTRSPNHWIFGTCRLDGTNHIFVAKHSTHSEDMACVFKFATCRTLLSPMDPNSEPASVVLSLMLEAILVRDEDGFLRIPHAPASWSIASSKMASALTQKCIKEGVTRDLCKVGVCSDRELFILERVRVIRRQKIAEMRRAASSPFASSAVSLGDNSKCHRCGSKRDCFFLPFLSCRCLGAFYHNYTCMSQHREQHLEACLWACDFNHYVGVAPLRQAARTLMRSLLLDFSKSKESVRLVVFRLILTGQDTSGNWTLLFGSDGGLDGSFEETREIYRAARIRCLLAPPPGSSAYRQISCMDDRHLGGKPRPASDDEEHMIKQVKGMQHYIRSKFKNAADETTPPSLVLENITRGFPKGDLKARMPIFHLALDTMKLPPVGNAGV